MRINLAENFARKVANCVTFCPIHTFQLEVITLNGIISSHKCKTLYDNFTLHELVA